MLKNVINKLKSIPCSSCKCLIHDNCSNNIKLFISYAEIPSWIFPSCIKNIFSYTYLNDFELNKLQGQISNSFNTKATTQNLTQTYDFYGAMTEETEINHTNCKYYDINEFRSLFPHQVSKNSFSIFLTNIPSLQGNFDKLELLLSQVEDVHNFDVISLTETWNPSSTRHLFNPKKCSNLSLKKIKPFLLI